MAVQNNIIITNQSNNKLVSHLKHELNNPELKSVDIIVAFINFGGVQLIINELKFALNRGVKVRILTSNYLLFSDPNALFKLSGMDNIELKMVDCNSLKQELHAKSYAFRENNKISIYVGSSNFTKTGIQTNIEWNMRSTSNLNDPLSNTFDKNFNELWELNTIDLNEYKLKYDLAKSDRLNAENEYRKNSKYTDTQFKDSFKMNKFQQIGLHNLSNLRKNGKDKGFVIAATGCGKTLLSILDVEQFKAQKILFVVHSTGILNDAYTVFANYFGNSYTYGVLNGNSKSFCDDIIFASSHTLYKDEHLFMFKPDHFDYIIYDEAHHLVSESQLKINNYFKPKFTLGLSATPERMDGKDVLALFDYNIAIEYRTMDAINEQQVSPFHYYGISDIVDYSNIKIHNQNELAKKLSINSRVDLIIEKLKLIDYDFSGKRKCIAFCSNVDHGNYMTAEFNKRDLKSVILTSNSSEITRADAIKRLRDEKDELEFIFVVDLFNEGIDIPEINLILMLRPTESSTIFIQQLGRGLRKTNRKEFLTVIDFIGNYDNNYQGLLALTNNQAYDPTSLRTRLKSGFVNLPPEVYINIDRISEEKIEEALSKINLSSKKYLETLYSNFKIALNNKKVIYLMDYFITDNAPDPFLFRYTNVKNYYSFVNIAEGREVFKLSARLCKILNYLSEFVPLRRKIEFEILLMLLSVDSVTNTELMKTSLSNNSHLDETDYNASLQLLMCDIYSEKEKNLKINTLIKLHDDRVSIADQYNQSELEILRDFLRYSINSYIYESALLESKNRLLYGKNYSYKTAVQVLNGYTTRSLSSYREGVAKLDNKFAIFINLHKDESISESIKYLDAIIDRQTLQWQSQSKTTQVSTQGIELISNLNKPNSWNIFIRKSSKIINGLTPKFIYIGTGYPVEYHGNKPITFKVKLDRPIDDSIYNELID